MALLSGIRSAVGRLIAGYPLKDPALVSLFGYGAETDSGIVVTPDNARECPEVDACIGLNEDTIATVPLDLFEKVGDDSRTRATGHPLHELVHDRPNQWQTSSEWRQMMEGYRETHGNAYSRIISANAGFPTALEPVHPNEMWPFRAPSGGVAYRWSPLDGPPRILLQHEVLHLKDTPARRYNLVQGESRVIRHSETIGRAMATSRYLSLYFKNNATPKIVLKIPGELTKPQIEDLRALFIQEHGRDNVHKPAVAHSGMEIDTIGSTNEDAQTVQLDEQTTAKIARIFDVPLHLIGETSKSTSWGTGIEQQSIGFVVYYMRAKFVAWEQSLNRALMSDETRKRFFFEFNMDALLRGDFKSRMDGYALMIQWGLSTPNEIRRLMNLPPLDGGDERLTPLNMVPATRIMDVLLKTPQTPQARTEALDMTTRLLSEIIPLLKKTNKRKTKEVIS